MRLLRRLTRLAKTVSQVPLCQLLQPRVPEAAFQVPQEGVCGAGAGVCAGACAEDGEQGAAEGEWEGGEEYWEVGGEFF